MELRQSSRIGKLHSQTKHTTKSSVFSTGLNKKTKKGTQTLEHSSYIEGVVTQVEGVK